MSGEIAEAPGSSGYINKDGDIDIVVVLQVFKFFWYVILKFLSIQKYWILHVIFLLDFLGSSQYFSKRQSNLFCTSLWNDNSHFGIINWNGHNSSTYFGGKYLQQLFVFFRTNFRFSENSKSDRSTNINL